MNFYVLISAKVQGKADDYERNMFFTRISPTLPGI